MFVIVVNLCEKHWQSLSMKQTHEQKKIYRKAVQEDTKLTKNSSFPIFSMQL